MDNNGFGRNGFNINFALSNALGNWSIVTTSGANSNPYNNYNSQPKGTKRKRVDFCGPHAGLSLGLAHSSSSDSSKPSSVATTHTASSGKETEGDSMDLGLNFHLSLANETSTGPKKPVSEPKLELELSLSVGPTESIVTTNTTLPPAPVQYQDLFRSHPYIASAPTVDEGSTSSRWKGGSTLLPYLTDTTNPGLSHHLADPTPSSTVPYQQRNGNTKTCSFPGCMKGARGASGLCIAHGGGRRCQKQGCGKGAEGRTIFCKAHGGGRRCEHLGCTKSAEGRTDFCIAHGGGRRCGHPDGCARAARGRSGLCIRHGGGKRCQKENCTKSAEGHSGLCIAHGGGRRCQYPQCTKGAQGSTNSCKAHGGGKRCTYEGCTKGAEGSTPFCKGHGGGKRCSFPGGCSKSVHGGTQFCVAHGGGKRCAVSGCTKSARGRTDFCVRHGGGKRCRVEGCGKSAQGSTDFCKAHGGGKRCTWGQAGSGFGENGLVCDRFARGKIGLCAAHTALLEDRRVHGGHTLGAAVTGQNGSRDMGAGGVEQVVLKEGGARVFGWEGIVGINNSVIVDRGKEVQDRPVPVLEGRVHGGRSLLALFGNQSTDRGEPSSSKQGASFSKWL